MGLSSDQQCASDDLSPSNTSSSVVIVRQNSVSMGLFIWMIISHLTIAGLLFHAYTFTKDGEWSNWGEWSVCNNGLRVRNRYCNNPTPYMFGQYCQGGSQVYELCDLDSCKISSQGSLKDKEECKLNSECADDVDIMQQTTNSMKKEILDEVLETVTQNERMTVKEIDTIKHTIEAMKTKTNRLIKDHKTLDNGFEAMKKQITADVKVVEKKTGVTTSDIEKVKRTIKSLESDTKAIDNQLNKMVSDQTMIKSIISKGPMFAFTAYGVFGTSQLVFPYVIDNIGEGYDRSTGKFTCTLPGIYYFSFHISKVYKSLSDLVECFIYHNQVMIVGSREDPSGTNKVNDMSGYSISVSSTFHLNSNDQVYVGGCTGSNALYADNRSSFTGFLVRPDE